MMKNTLITALTVALVVSGVFLVFSPKAERVVELGAVASPDVASPYLSFGGVRRWAYSTDSLTTATTTVCAIQSPVATSTLVSAGIRFTTSSTTASTVTIAKAATPYATTTSLGVASISANAQGTVLATTTPVTPLDDVTIFAPSQYLVVGMAGGVGTFSPVGTCHAVWEQF